VLRHSSRLPCRRSCPWPDLQLVSDRAHVVSDTFAAPSIGTDTSPPVECTTGLSTSGRRESPATELRRRRRVSCAPPRAAYPADVLRKGLATGHTSTDPSHTASPHSAPHEFAETDAGSCPASPHSASPGPGNASERLHFHSSFTRAPEGLGPVPRAETPCALGVAAIGRALHRRRRLRGPRSSQSPPLPAYRYTAR